MGSRGFTDTRTDAAAAARRQALPCLWRGGRRCAAAAAAGVQPYVPLAAALGRDEDAVEPPALVGEDGVEPGAGEDQDDDESEEEEKEDFYNNSRNEEDDKLQIDMPPQRDVRDTHQTISVNYRVIKNNSDNNQKYDEDNSTSSQNQDDWNEEDNEW